MGANQIPPVTTLPEIEYFTLEELPGRTMFRCEPRRCTMQVAHCASMWQQANERGAPERLDACRSCQVGAKHAGVEEMSLSPLRGVSICGRCVTGTTRLIRGHLCPSCYNRQLEYVKGRNAKGAFPVMHPKLYPLKVRIRSGGAVKDFGKGDVVDTAELVVSVLRDEGMQAAFSFSSIKPRVGVVMQGELF